MCFRQACVEGDGAPAASGRGIERGLAARQRDAQRLSREWTLENASEKADLDLEHWQKIEAGGSPSSPPLNVTLVTLVRIAGAFNVPVAELFRPLARERRPNGRGTKEMLPR